MTSHDDTAYNLRIVHITDNPVVDPVGALQSVSEKDYQLARNVVVRVCQCYGSTGPSGECHFEINNKGEEDPIWEIVKGDDFEFYVVDDQINYERYLYIELSNGSLISRKFISDLAVEMIQLPFWGVVLTAPHVGTFIVFFNVIFLYGVGFERCVDLETLLLELQRPKNN